jgi:transcriptional regulator with XRE-family HTH domain
MRAVRRAQSPFVARDRRPRATPPSKVGRLLSDLLDEHYAGNVTRLAEAIGVSRQTLYGWLSQPAPPVPDPAHRQRIAQMLQVDVTAVDTMVVTDMGYRVTSVTSKALPVAVLVDQLPADEVAEFERQALARVRRNAQMRKGRRT